MAAVGQLAPRLFPKLRVVKDLQDAAACRGFWSSPSVDDVAEALDVVSSTTGPPWPRTCAPANPYFLARRGEARAPASFRGAATRCELGGLVAAVRRLSEGQAGAEARLADHLFLRDVLSTRHDFAAFRVTALTAPATDAPFERLAREGHEVLVRSGSPFPRHYRVSGDVNLAVRRRGPPHAGLRYPGLRARRPGELTRAHLGETPMASWSKAAL